jgi:hypothetical protein
VSAGSASPGFLAPSNTRRRVPRFHRAAPRRLAVDERSPIPRRCRPQGSCPSRRFWLHFTTQRAPRGTRRRSRRPDVLRPYSMPLAFLESPFRAFSLSRSRARSRAPLLPCGFAFDRCLAQTRPRLSRPLSAPRRPFAAAHPCGLAGLRGREDASSRPLRRSVVRAAKRVDRDRRSRSRRARLLAAVTPASKPCSPREVRARDDRTPCGARPSGRCSPGLRPPLELAPMRFRVRSFADAHDARVAPPVMRLEGPVARVVRELLVPTPGS